MSSINNEPIEYKQLSKTQKMAIFCMTIGAEGASFILSQFEDGEIEAICRAISKMTMVDEALKNEVVKEMIGIIGRTSGSVFGGMDFAQKTLDNPDATRNTAYLLEKIRPGGSTAEMINELGEMEVIQIYNLISEEQEQLIAFLVSNLNIDKAVDLIMMLTEEKRGQVLISLGQMTDAPLEMLARVARVMKSQVRKGEQYTMQEQGGVSMVADLINMLDKEIGKDVLTKLEESDPELGAAVSNKMVTFNDLVKLEIVDLQRVVREIEMSDLIVAMKTATEALKEMIMKSVSKRAAESLQEELEMLGPVKVKDVNEAQERIINIVKRLEEEGTISFGGEGDDVIA